jgi:hypothetical protein
MHSPAKHQPQLSHAIKDIGKMAIVVRLAANFAYNAAVLQIAIHARMDIKFQ